MGVAFVVVILHMRISLSSFHSTLQILIHLFLAMHLYQYIN